MQCLCVAFALEANPKSCVQPASAVTCDCQPGSDIGYYSVLPVGQQRGLHHACGMLRRFSCCQEILSHVAGNGHEWGLLYAGDLCHFVCESLVLRSCLAAPWSRVLAGGVMRCNFDQIVF
jgi:hypothetical protein